MSEIPERLWYYTNLQSPTGIRPLKRDAWKELADRMDFSEAAIPEVEPDALGSTGLAWAMILPLLQVLGVVALIAVLVYAIVRITGNRLAAKKSRSQTVETLPDEELPTASAPLEALYEALRKARESGNYREAVRLLYQIAIKKLDMAGILSAHPDKTNWEYIHELSGSGFEHDFTYITLIFERSWFGMAQLSQNDFEHYAPLFENLTAPGRP